jgi:hypothetical protein
MTLKTSKCKYNTDVSHTDCHEIGVNISASYLTGS